MRINWNLLADESEVSRAIYEALPEAPTLDDVLSFAKENQLECSDLTGNIIYSSAPAKSKLPLVKSKWLIEFQFSEDRLKQVKIQLGLIGP
jgi:hypothetical protein